MSRLRELFPPPPPFTEALLPDLTGKVYLITGSNSGIGLLLAQLLYAKHATVYLAARSEEKTLPAIEQLRAAAPDSKGKAVFLHLDLADLTSVKKAAAAFLASETRLNVLFHNAGLLAPPEGTATAQGHDIQMGVHCLGPLLLTKLLEGVLRKTAATEEKGAVRIIWVSSSAATMAPTGGVEMENVDYTKAKKSNVDRYFISKAGTFFLAGEYASRVADSGIVSVSLDPGNLKTNLFRSLPDTIGKVQMWFLSFLLHEPIKGAQCELFAGFSPEVTLEACKDGAMWVVPFGKLVEFKRKDILGELTARRNDKAGNAINFLDWCEGEIKGYL